MQNKINETAQDLENTKELNHRLIDEINEGKQYELIKYNVVFQIKLYLLLNLSFANIAKQKYTPLENKMHETAREIG